MHCLQKELVCIVASAMLYISGCSDKQAAAPSTPASAATASPAVDTEPVHEAPAPGEQTLVAQVAAGGIPTRYVAHFEQDKLTRIEETREADQRRGIYEFHGARLIRYSGAALDSAASLTFELSMQGAVESSLSNGGPAGEAAIAAIRDRGQLLRSHAVAQRAARAHNMH